MATIGEIFRWVAINVELLQKLIARLYRRAIGRVLRSDLAVARSERRFHALLESAPDAMVIVDWHGHVKLVNAQAEKQFGWSRKELVGKNVSQLIPERYRGYHREHLKRYVRAPGARPMGTGLDLYGRRKDGSEFPVEISLGPLETEQGLLVSAAIRDITARKQAEGALREAEERFRTAFEEAPVGMALVNLEGHILQVNRALSDITGHSSEQLEATTLSAISHPSEQRTTAESASA